MINESPRGGERVILVHVNFPTGKMEEDLAEFKELATSAGAQIVDTVMGTLKVPNAKYFVGLGKAEEIRDLIAATKVQLVLFNHVLTPAQERNLEKLFQCRVLDRTGLILDIFALRARSFEGKLQIELAYLKHQSTRLIRGWTHLERQRGGIGLRGGPGETQLEVDRRLLRDKMKIISAKLEKMRRQREQGRRARRKAIVPTIALVGYTNAGKSTLFNRLTGSNVYVADQLFATLDPTLRRIDFAEYGSIILADTVGFIRHLPHHLIEAFHGTLEEVSEADLLLHVVDANDENKHDHIHEVNKVLESIHADKVPRILVFNKIDLNPTFEPKIEKNEQGEVHKVFISAATGLGMKELGAAIGEALGKEMTVQEVILLPQQAKLRAELYEREAVLLENIDEEGKSHLTIRLPQEDFNQLLKRKTQLSSD